MLELAMIANVFAIALEISGYISSKIAFNLAPRVMQSGYLFNICCKLMSLISCGSIFIIVYWLLCFCEWTANRNFLFDG